jgi:hypothetical protein
MVLVRIGPREKIGQRRNVTEDPSEGRNTDHCRIQDCTQQTHRVPEGGHLMSSVQPWQQLFQRCHPAVAALEQLAAPGSAQDHQVMHGMWLRDSRASTQGLLVVDGSHTWMGCAPGSDSPLRASAAASVRRCERPAAESAASLMQSHLRALLRSLQFSCKL